MFRWKSEKNKIKYVFKLQFHATQVPELNVDSLTVSVVPGDVGKPSAKLEKGLIGGGSCLWECPIFETVKFNQDAKTGKINERLYHFIVSTGSSKNSLIGEVSIDLADYAEATKASTVSLPLKNSKSNTVLHITIQRSQGNTNPRDVEETEDAKKTQNTLNTLLSNGNPDEGILKKSNEVQRINGANHNAELNVNLRTSNESDITMSSSDSSPGLNTPREIRLRNNSHAAAPHKATANGSATVYEGLQQSQSEWSADSDNGTITDESLQGSQTSLTRERCDGISDAEIEKLMAENAAFARQADLSNLELQTLRKQIVKGSKREKDLLKEIARLKDELKRAEVAKSKNTSQYEGVDPWILLDEANQELAHLKDLNANLQLQQQKTQESNSELILVVQDLKEMLEQKNREAFNPSKKSGSSGLIRSETDDDEEQKALEELVKDHRGAEDSYVLEQKVSDLRSEIEMYRREKDELEMQMEQLALDYEILKQENHDMSYRLEQSQLQEQLKMQYECSSSSFANINELEAHIESLENELKKQCKEHSDSLLIIDELENHIKSLGDELEKQAQRFEADLETVINLKIEQEKKAIQAEEALRKTRLKITNTAEKLLEEVNRISVGMATTVKANQKVALEAKAEADELRIQKNQLEQMLQEAKEKLRLVRDDYGEKLNGLTDQLNLKIEQIEQLLGQIQLKETALESSAKSFLEKEKELVDKIDELEKQVDELNQKSTTFSFNPCQKLQEEVNGVIENGECNNNELLSEHELLKEKIILMETELESQREKNELMESELKEMQERYSDISLKFAEVEGERQQLKMTLRSLKNSKKS